MPRLVIGLAIALTLTLFPSSSEAQQQMTLTPQFSLGTLDQPTPDPAFEAQTRGELQGFVKASPGFSGAALLLSKDRGPHTGRYAAVITAPAGSGRYLTTATRTVPTLVQYQLIGADKLGPLPTVDVLAIHYIKVRPDRKDAFERFVAEKLHPAVGNLRPDLRFLYYKAVPEGLQAGSYVTVVALTKASRDKYWPNGSDSDALKEAFTPAVKALATELQTYLVDGTWGTGMTAQVYEAKEWADWVVVK